MLNLRYREPEEIKRLINRFYIEAIEAMGLSLPDNKDACIKHLYDNLMDSEGKISRPLFEQIHSWTIFLSELLKFYFDERLTEYDADGNYNEKYDEQYEEMYDNFLTLPDIPQKVKEAYTLEIKINELLDDLMEYDRGVQSTRRKLVSPA
jgi:hypothetical protein